MILFYHHDFDGVLSAALTARALADYGTKVRDFFPVDYRPDLDWREPPAQAGGQRFGVVDFQYHPHAVLWFDHHETPFSNPADRLGVDARRRVEPGPFKWNASYGSCAALIEATYWPVADPTKFTDQQARSDLVTAASLIDSHPHSLASTPADYYRPEARQLQWLAPLRLAHAIKSLTHGELRKVIAALMEYDGEGAEWAVRSKTTAAIRRAQTALKNAGERCFRLGEHAVLFDAVGRDCGVARYAPFHHYPTTHVSLCLYSLGTQHVRLSLSYNPWSVGHLPKWPDLSRFVEPHGGGGHRHVAGVTFSATEHVSPYSAALATAQRLASDLNTALKDAA